MFSSSSDSLSESTANWLGERKEVEAQLVVGTWPLSVLGVELV